MIHSCLSVYSWGFYFAETNTRFKITRQREISCWLQNIQVTMFFLDCLLDLSDMI